YVNTFTRSRFYGQQPSVRETLAVDSSHETAPRTVTRAAEREAPARQLLVPLDEIRLPGCCPPKRGRRGYPLHLSGGNRPLHRGRDRHPQRRSTNFLASLALVPAGRRRAG